jgi:hypothetical protein
MKKVKYLLTVKYTALLVLLSIASAFITGGVARAAAPTGVAYCFIVTTGITYQCGPGTGDTTNVPTGNSCTPLPIYDTNNQKIGGPTCAGTTLYQFVAGNCYS